MSLIYYRLTQNYWWVNVLFIYQRKAFSYLFKWEKTKLPCQYLNVGDSRWSTLSKRFSHFPPLSFPSPSFLSFSSFSYYLEYNSITTQKLSLQRNDLKSGIREEIKPSLLQPGDHWSQSSHLYHTMNTWKRSYFTLLSSHPERVAGSTGNHIHFVDSTMETEMEPAHMRSSPW